LSELLSLTVFLSLLYFLILDVGGIYSILFRTDFTSRVFLLSGTHFLDHYLKASDFWFLNVGFKHLFHLVYNN